MIREELRYPNAEAAAAWAYVRTSLRLNEPMSTAKTCTSQLDSLELVASTFVTAMPAVQIVDGPCPRRSGWTAPRTGVGPQRCLMSVRLGWRRAVLGAQW